MDRKFTGEQDFVKPLAQLKREMIEYIKWNGTIKFDDDEFLWVVKRDRYGAIKGYERIHFDYLDEDGILHYSWGRTYRLEDLTFDSLATLTMYE